MPVTHDVLPRCNLAVFAYSGQVAYAEVAEAVAAVARHRDHTPSMNQLCDLSAVVGVERNFAALLQMQARIADSLLPTYGDRLVVFYAPTPIARAIAETARKSWDGLGSVLVRVLEREEDALALLGLPHRHISDLTRLGA